MKKLTVILMFVLALSLSACGSNSGSIPNGTPEAKQDKSAGDTAAVETSTLTCYGYMVIEDNTLSLDEVEIINEDDEERIAELSLTERLEFTNPFIIRPLNKEIAEYELTADTVYNFVDFGLLFVIDADGDRQYSTTSKDEFIQYLNTTYSDSPPAQKIPFLIEARDGKVISVTEEFRFTI